VSNSGVDYVREHADSAIRLIWSDNHNVILERRLWVAILRQHARYGLVPLDIVWYYANSILEVDLDRIRERELVTRHDVKARIEEFNYVASCLYDEIVGQQIELQFIHLGCTSADIVDNVALIKLQQTAQTLGFDSLAGWVPWRGVVGAVGTGQDQLDLLPSVHAYEAMQGEIMAEFSFTRLLGSVAQVYPRAIDAHWADTIYTHAIDDHTPKHWRFIANGYRTMLGEMVGQQWNEGDVSTSVIRRVALSGLAFAASAAIETTKQEEATK
jgi:adenylosuccinate lyase